MPIADIDCSEYFTASKLADLRETFNEVDTSKDGHIEEKELKAMFRKNGWNMSTSQVKDVIADVDYDNSGMLEFEEYCVMIIKMQKLRPRPDLIDHRDWLDERTISRLQALWTEHDSLGLGSMDVAKLDEMLVVLGCRAKSDFVEETIFQALGDSRRFDFEQLCRIWAVLGMGRKLINFREYLTPEQVKKFKVRFDTFAQQKRLSAAQLDPLLRRLGYALNKKQLLALYTDFDTDGSGSIEFPEFGVMMARLSRARRLREISPQTFENCRPLWEEEGFDVGELRKCGFGVMDFRKAGIPVGAIYQQGAASALELRRSGYSSSELRRGGLGAADLRKCGFGLAELRNAGFSEDILAEVNRSVKQSLSAGDLSCLTPQTKRSAPMSPPPSWEKMLAVRCTTPLIRAHHDGSLGLGATVAPTVAPPVARNGGRRLSTGATAQ